MCWGVTGTVAVLALALPDQFDLLPVLARREMLDFALFSALGFFWLITAFAAFAFGDAAGRWGFVPSLRVADRGLDRVRAARLVFWVNLGLLAVTGLWVLASANRLGGMAQLVVLALADTVTARDLLLENKLFTGMRLFYAALPATGCLAAALLASGLPNRARMLCRVTLAANALALTLLPVVMSQRLLLLQFLLSTYLVTCLVHRRVLAVPGLIGAILLFLGVWMARESLTNPVFDRSAADLAVQKLAFYFINDSWNAFAPVSMDGPRLFGAVTFRGLAFLTGTEPWLDGLLSHRMAAIEAMRGGGEFPLLTAPFVDFGPVAGAAVLGVIGFLCGRMFVLAHRRLVWAVVYAQVGAGLLFSSHGNYLTHQNLLFGLVVCALIAALSKPRGRSCMGAAVVLRADPPACRVQFRSRRVGAAVPAVVPAQSLRSPELEPEREVAHA